LHKTNIVEDFAKKQNLDWPSTFTSLTQMMINQARGVPTGLHAQWTKFNIDSFSISDSGISKTSPVSAVAKCALPRFLCSRVVPDEAG
jgi:hypothetical protein